jgi:hypothetical protein
LYINPIPIEGSQYNATTLPETVTSLCGCSLSQRVPERYSIESILSFPSYHIEVKIRHVPFDVIILASIQARMSIAQVLPEELDVLCTHPMFGPESGKNGWKDLAFMYERVRIKDEATCSSFLRIFETEVT